MRPLDIARRPQPFVVERRQVVLGVGQALLGRALIPARRGRVILGNAEPEVIGHAELELGLGQAAAGGGFQELDLVLVRVGLERTDALQPRQCEPGEVEAAGRRSPVPARRLLGVFRHAQSVLVECAEIELRVDIAGVGELGPGRARLVVVATLKRLVGLEEVGALCLRRGERSHAKRRRTHCGSKRGHPELSQGDAVHAVGGTRSLRRGARRRRPCLTLHACTRSSIN